MADKNYLYDSEDFLERPSHYDNFFNPIITPYRFQNVNEEKYNNNVDLINKEFPKSILQDSTGHWIRIINTEDYIDEKSATIEAEIIKKYGELVQNYYGLGNRDLLENPEVGYETIRSYGYEVSEDSILYPQSTLRWNETYNKWFAIWYTPIKEDGSIVSKANAESYLTTLFTNTDFLAADKEGNNIILRIDKELGFSAIDVISVGKTYETDNVKRVRQELSNWSTALTQAQQYYWDLVETYGNVDGSNYLFIDEDKNIFSRTNRKSYFTFKVEKNNYTDLGIALDEEISSLQDWQQNTDYKIGDYVLHNETINGVETPYLYYCVRDNNSGETFEVAAVVKRKQYGQEVDVLVAQWKLVSTEYGKELNKILERFPHFNPERYYRFVFPALEDRRPRQYYPNGELKADAQRGSLYINQSTDEENRFFAVTPCYAYDPNTGKDNIEYKIVANADISSNYIEEEEGYVGPKKYITSAQKIIIYFDKLALANNNIVSMSFDSKVTKIAKDAFYKRDDLLKVSIRQGAQSIGNRAFGGCTNLQQALLPGSLVVMGDGLFAGCRLLKRATVPPNVISLNATFNGCESLESAVLSPFTVEIGDSAFSNCLNLKKVYNTSKVSILGKSAFLNCESLKNFTINKEIISIPDRAFKNCKNCHFTLEEREEGEELISLGISSFEGCEQLTETFDLSKIQLLGDGAYKNCSNIQEMNFNFGDDYVSKLIPKGFCYGCYNLKTINLGEAEILDDGCFQNCASLREVTIPTTVKQLGTNVFYDCFNLKTLKVPTVYPSGVGAWIENPNIVSDANRINWIDPTFTTVTNYNGDVIKWKKAVIH